MNRPIAVGTRLEIKGDKLELSGCVRRCIRDGYDYFVGVQKSLSVGRVVENGS